MGPAPRCWEKRAPYAGPKLRREAFAQWFALGVPGWRACQLAGYRGRKPSLYAQGSRLLADERVQQLIADAQRERQDLLASKMLAVADRLEVAAIGEMWRGGRARYARVFEFIRQLESRELRALVEVDELEDDPRVIDIGERQSVAALPPSLPVTNNLRRYVAQRRQ